MTDVDRLLVLKAYYLGHAISENRQSRSTALDMVDAAIEYLRTTNQEENEVRLLFYILLKAEILRDTSDAIVLRKEAQELSQAIPSDAFQHYMAVADATQTKSKVHGIQTGMIANKGVQTIESYVVSDGSNAWTVEFDAACRALRIGEYRLTKKERHFLQKITLKELLEKHGVTYPRAAQAVEQ